MPSAPDPCVLVIFGASGDLTSRKLIPALYEMAVTKALPEATRVLGVSRTEMSEDAWRDQLQPWVREHAKGFNPASWAAFARRLHYVAGSGADPAFYPPLVRRVEELAARVGTGNVLF